MAGKNGPAWAKGVGGQPAWAKGVGNSQPAWAKGVKVQKKKPSALKRGIAALGIIGNVYGAGTTLPQSGTVPLNDEGESSVRGERDTRARGQRGETRNRGRRTGGSRQR